MQHHTDAFSIIKQPSRPPLQLEIMKSKTELTQLDKEELIAIILKMQGQLERIPSMEQELSELRNEVAEEVQSQELVEESEINTFRRLSQQCAEEGIEIQTSTRAGSNVDEMGSLSNVVNRRDISFVGSLSNTPNSTRMPSNEGFRVGSMAPAIQTMSASLTTSAYQRQSSEGNAPLLLGSFSTSGASGQVRSSGFNVVTEGSESQAKKESSVRINLVASKVDDDDDDNVDIVM